MGSGSIYGPENIRMLEVRMGDRNYPESVLGSGQSSTCYHEDMVAARNVDVE